MQKSPKGDVSLLFSSRLFITTMCFCGVLFMVTARLNMSVAIVCMVNHTTTISSNAREVALRNGSIEYYDSATNRNGTITQDRNWYPGGDLSTTQHRSTKCSPKNASESDNRKTDGPFEWSKQQQGTILGAYFWGYLIFQIPAGWTVRKFGSIRMLGFSTFISSLVCLLTPTLAYQSYIFVIVLRICAGFVAGMICPSVHNLLSNWLPPTERATMGSIAYAGFPFGALVTFTGSGLLCKYGFADGWQSIFYLNGGLGVLFCFAWCLFVSETPALHKRISIAEKEFIQSKVKDSMKEVKTLKTPWSAILTSLPVNAIMFSSIANDFFSIIMWLFLPMYLNDVMNFDILSNGILSSLPYLLQFLTSILFGWISDAMLRRRWLSIGTSRKLFCTAGKVVCICSLIAVGFIDCDQAALAVTLLVMSIGALGLMTLGYYVNPLDIAPVYSGLIIAMANTVGTVTGVISPYIVSAVIGENTSRESWQTIFLISAAVIAAALVFYACFASGEVQPWAQRHSQCQDNDSVEGAGLAHES